MKLRNNLFFYIGIGTLVSAVNAENLNDINQGDTMQQPEAAQVEVLDDTNSVMVNGRRIPKAEIIPEIDLMAAGPNTGIQVFRASGVPSDIAPDGNWWDAGVESVGRNGVIGAAAEDNGIGILGITRYVGNAAVVGYHAPDQADGSGYGVQGYSSSVNGVGVHGMNFGGGLAGRFDGDVAQTLDNNGIVKAWAKIASDGSVVSCYNCDKDTSVTFQVATGAYRVAFTPLGNIFSRPRTATLDTHQYGLILGEIGLAADASNPNALFVLTADSVGTNTDKSFTVIIY